MLKNKFSAVKGGGTGSGTGEVKSAGGAASVNRSAANKKSASVLDSRLTSTLLKTRDSYLKKLKELEIKSLRDLLYFFPRTYRDEQEFTRINEMRTDAVNVVRGRIKSILNLPTHGRMLVTRAVIADETGEVPVIWFNQPYVKQLFFKGGDIILTGKLKFEHGKSVMVSPKYEKPSAILLHTGRLVPIYPESEEITSKWLREKIYMLLPYAKFFDDFLPQEILDREGLMGLSEAISAVHFPRSEEELKRARERLAFDELFLLQLMALRRRREWRRGAETLCTRAAAVNLDPFFSALPFKLTGAQNRVIGEIMKDLSGIEPMLRLIQGDVGSGKTVVAAAAAYSIHKAGHQVAIMAPTEILARQHHNNLTKLLSPFGMRVGLLLGSQGAAEKKAVLEELASGAVHLIIGTHALISEGVNFASLGLAVIDEQHRFGVKQRAVFSAGKEKIPHILNLSATPIPRTMALTIYGDQDLSILDELPPGRQEIITRIVPENKRGDAYKWVSDQVKKGRQVFVICPLIDESDALQVKAATLEFERLSKEIFPGHRLALLHGRMKSDDKEATMNNFSAGKVDILVSTSVVEVGIDVPNATIMIIEGADRFGLAQLHQFRGRVGRGANQSYCFLFSDSQSENALQRLKYMVKFASGFDLAELDLKMRGPGEVYGVKQSGIPDLKMASFTDIDLLTRVRTAAERLVAEDSELTFWPALRSEILALEAASDLKAAM
ncbi:MAG: ATP-dependent DNA helicase RecG [Candidatus Gracilibacteria bacterium]|jgi:ATP-dependent DNA helicase RecG